MMVAKKETNKVQLKLILKKEPNLAYKPIFGKIASHSRSRVKLSETKDRLVVTISSEDTTSLRASTNTILRKLQIIEATRTKTDRK